MAAHRSSGGDEDLDEADMTLVVDPPNFRYTARNTITL